jgi:hypothetical protein
MAQRAKALSRSLAGMLCFAQKVLRLGDLLSGKGDGRIAPEINGLVLMRALLCGLMLRVPSFLRIESLPLSGKKKFSNDTLGYFVERFSPQVLRKALSDVLRRAKRNKAFAQAPLLGFAIDGTKLGHFSASTCPLCRAHDREHPEKGYYHGLCALSVVGAGITLPVDCEPYGPGDSEYTAGQRLLRRAIGALGPRFAQYVTGDGNFATAPFLHVADECGIYVLARLKENLPELLSAARGRFQSQPPHVVLEQDNRRIELWDAQDFEPWEALHWNWVRVLRYRYEANDGSIVDAYWLTNMPQAFATSQTLYACAKNRWEIENQVFNDAKNRYGLAHTPHHEQNSVLVHWLLVFLAMVIERLYRLRHLRRGRRQPISAQKLHDLLWQHPHIPITNTS